jgi:hypothetical protein
MNEFGAKGIFQESGLELCAASKRKHLQANIGM